MRFSLLSKFSPGEAGKRHRRRAGGDPVVVVASGCRHEFGEVAISKAHSSRQTLGHEAADAAADHGRQASVTPAGEDVDGRIMQAAQLQLGKMGSKIVPDVIGSIGCILSDHTGEPRAGGGEALVASVGAVLLIRCRSLVT